MEQSTALLLPLTQSPQHHLPLPTFRIHHLLPPHPSPPTSPSFTSYLPILHLLPSPSSPPTFTTLSRCHSPLTTTHFGRSWLTACSDDLDLIQKGVRRGSLASHRSGLLPLSVTYTAGLKALEDVSAHAEAPEILISSPGP